MEIRVSREPADRIGDDIVDPLLTDNAVGFERGRFELNEQVSAITHEFVGPLNNLQETGSLVQLADSRQVVRGKVTYFNQNQAQVCFRPA